MSPKRPSQAASQVASQAQDETSDKTLDDPSSNPSNNPSDEPSNSTADKTPDKTPDTSPKQTTLKKHIPPKPHKETQPSFWPTLARSTLLLLLSGAACTISQLSLSPIYGTIPASTWHATIQVHSSLFAGLLYYLAPASAPFLEKCLPLHIAAVPVHLHYALVPLSSTLGPSYGPLVTEMALLMPVLLLTQLAISIRISSFIKDSSKFVHLVPLFILLMGQVTASSARVFKFAYDYNIVFYRDDPLYSRWALQTILTALYAVTCPSRLLVLLIPTLFFQFYSNPHAPLSHTTARLNSALSRETGFVLRDRLESKTGYLSVLESLDAGFRVLRCDHSLLGGNWLPTPERAADGILVPEPIYPVFTMLEAVRLMSDPDMPPPLQRLHPENALVIGLGIGTCPKALNDHGIQTTVLELDRGVTSLARRWFDVPNDLIIHTTDAKDWVTGALSSAKIPEYDFLIHDVFTGGAEPLPLFEHAFLWDLRKLLAIGGKAAINYAGDLTDPHTLDVLETINTAFEENCKVYRESPRPDTYDGGADFTNLVVFCANAWVEGKVRPTWHWRDVNESDYLGSVSRRRALPPRHRVDVRKLRKQHPRVEGKSGVVDQRRSAEDHWRIMRMVLPSRVWELY
ncbi:MAG: hypothetical protein Q9162_005353 [Coniocarpon cinnabarinum]